ncbi:hypothetical protein INP83_06630 [Mucilaginibacter sp. 21P]|uniref:hypothetical protein n=1 Tax=Mucilaginibacter sp. 21P TaxID=2778902 RepID=UPI001C563042|nr:hypothetical protein [Mucilaginibacter sp. 21P]QXV66755.1 hypothetical protein INP83_06630 [Mucilaginibacter sp. 21P]
MILKKWLIFLVSAWLINTLVCFHGAELFDAQPAKGFTYIINGHAPQNLVVWLGKQTKVTDSDGATKPLKIKFRYRYLHSPYQSLLIYWRRAEMILWQADSFAMIIKRAMRTTRSLVSAQLSAIPIFRLTPF